MNDINPHPAERAKPMESVPLCVILSKEKIDSPWCDFLWKPVAVVLDAPASVDGKIRQHGEGWTHYFLECDPLELHRKDAPAYRDCLLEEDQASLWVVLQEEDEGELPYSVQLVTASPYEAQDYLDSGELIVEAVEIPTLQRVFIQDYGDNCPGEEAFIKRKQKKKFVDEHTFGQQSLNEIRNLEKKGN